MYIFAVYGPALAYSVEAGICPAVPDHISGIDRVDQDRPDSRICPESAVDVRPLRPAWRRGIFLIEWEKYREEMIADALKQISQDGISCYLFYNGDAIEARIKECLEAAKDLHEKKHYGSSVVCSCSVVEVTIRYFILSPLLQGMFLYDEWIETLTGRIVSGRAAEDRELLPSILKFWQFDINSLKLSTGEPLWMVLHEKIWRARNRYVHRGDPVSGEISSQGIEAATLLTELAKRVLLKATGRSKHNGGWGSPESGKNPFST